MLPSLLRPVTVLRLISSAVKTTSIKFLTICDAVLARINASLERGTTTPQSMSTYTQKQQLACVFTNIMHEVCGLPCNESRTDTN
jgi:hypothetical protein